MTSDKLQARTARLLIICGPTATGKTQLAFQLAKEFNGEIISADSRQVYQFMDIVTGKDIPQGFRVQSSEISFQNRPIPFYGDGKTRIWGYDLVIPDEEWSVKLFQDFAEIIIADIYGRDKLPIVVGGTGLYLKALTEPLPLISFPRNLSLRKKLEKKSATELYTMLLEKNRVRALSMNESDRQNPRRLIRALEIAEFEKVRPRLTGSDLHKLPYDVLWIGLTVRDRQNLFHHIDKRVDLRVGPRLWEELEFLKKKAFFGAAPSQTIGYRQLIPYITGEISQDEAKERWKFAEHDYARQQLTWFKKQQNIHWFDVAESTYKNRVAMLIRQWYDGANASRRQSSLN